MNRRETLQTLGIASAALVMAPLACTPTDNKKKTDFRYCLNTSTIRGQQQGLEKDIETAARAGYGAVELWIRDIEIYQNDGKTLSQLNSFIKDNGLEVASAIGFAPWMVDDSAVSKQGFAQMEREMEIMAALDCKRIAAPAAGQFVNPKLDLFDAGEKYGQLIELGRKTGVMPQLEFWGASTVLSHIGQILMIGAIANKPDVRFLPDVYHMFRGGSGYDTLKILNGDMIEVFHMNDFPTHIQRTEQKDSDRVYPGDGGAPMQQIITDLKNMGGVKYLSLELFNPVYWEEDALEVASKGLEKMKKFSG